MSAYVVDENHIRFMVEAATCRSLGSMHDGGLRWYHGETLHELRLLDSDGATAAGQMLWDENVRSVKHRYPDCSDDTLPGPIGCSFVYEHGNRPRLRPIDPVAVLKACDGYEYQSCEHPEWEQSEAKAFIDELRSRAIHSLPGYDDAAWEVTDAA